jgi:hypothetical protein
MSGRRSRTKGFTFERQAVNIAREYGLTAQRAWGSDGRNLGQAKEVDVMIEEWRLDLKRRKTLPEYMKIPEGCDGKLTRNDRGESVITIKYRDWLRLVECAKQNSKISG